MEIILLEDVEGLGTRGNRLRVADGYARNYLIPRGLAVNVRGAGEALFREAIRTRERREAKHRRAAEALLEQMRGVEVRIHAQAGEEGKLFGSVTASEIAVALAEKGYDIDRKSIQLEEPIKQTGAYDVGVRLAPQVLGQIKVWVEKIAS
jgi:large subunit ribosomal protein L9